MDHCYYTGLPEPHIHHILYGSRRKLSEEYGFVIPLAPHLHMNAKGSVHQNPNHGLDLRLKQMAQTYFEEHIGDRDEFWKVLVIGITPDADGLIYITELWQTVCHDT